MRVHTILRCGVVGGGDLAARVDGVTDTSGDFPNHLEPRGKWIKQYSETCVNGHLY